MRFPNQATVDDLQALITACDDRSASHILWIHQDGEVHATRVEPGQMFCDVHERICRGGAIYMFEALARGGGWVGPGAAADPEWTAELLAHLEQGWTRYCTEMARSNAQTRVAKPTKKRSIVEILGLDEEF